MKNALSEMDEAEQRVLLEEFQGLAKLMSHNSEEIVVVNDSEEMTTIESPNPLVERKDATLKLDNKNKRDRDSTYFTEPSFANIENPRASFHG